jgi:hypothetical protein
MNCARFARILADYHEGKVAPEQEAMAKAHLEKCPSCRKLQEVTYGGVDILPPEMREDLTLSILEKTSGGPVCPRVESSLWEFVLGQEAAEETQLIALHLDHCTRCSLIAEAIESIQEDLPALAEIDPGETFTHEMVRVTSGRRPYRPDLRVRFGAWWNRMVQRPRFALESAYICTMLLLFVLSPFLPFRHVVLHTIPSNAINPSARYAASLWKDAQVSITGQASQIEAALVSGTGAAYAVVERAAGRAVRGSSMGLQQGLERIGGWHMKEADGLGAFWNRLSAWIPRHKS